MSTNCLQILLSIMGKGLNFQSIIIQKINDEFSMLKRFLSAITARINIGPNKRH
jgi:hypothetical protein